MGSLPLLLLGVAFHALCIRSVLDIYFQSSVASDIQSFEYTSAPPAKRVVIFTMDGCRVDQLFKVTTAFPDRLSLDIDSTTAAEAALGNRAPFLGDVIRRRGSWGVSHNHVPTESRPCHVALTAGMYEDPHAVTKGWKEHPLPFDSVFNQSSSAFIFGNSDVVPKLARHAPQATEEHYSRKEENEMAREDTTLMDIWVYRKLKELLARGMEGKDANLHAQLHTERLVIYCHLQGTDMTGPMYGTNSSEYLANIAVVDELVEKMETLVEEYFDHDDQTAYVFTADHGMDLHGAHGDENPTNTRTALVAWGAGVQGPITANNSSTKATQFELDLPTQSKAEVLARLQTQAVQEQTAIREWSTLVNWQRKDVMQVDVAPLISALVGLPYPRNSVGVLPFTYLTKNSYRANAIRANAEQLYQHALRKEQIKRAHRGWLFVPYPPFRDRAPLLADQVSDAFSSLSDDEDEGISTQDEKAHQLIETLSQELIEICRDAIDYYQQYDWLYLVAVLMLGYTGWMLVMAVGYLHSLEFRIHWLVRDLFNVTFVASAASMILWRVLADSPSTFYLYAAFPLLFWCFIWNHRAQLRVAIARELQGGKTTISGWGWWTEGALILLCLELVVLGYKHREMFGVLFFVLSLWPLINAGRTRKGRQDTDQAERSGGRKPLSPSVFWSASCLCVCIFPFLPSEYAENTPLVHVGGLLTLIFAFAVLRTVPSMHTSPETQHWKPVLVAGAVPVVLALIALQWTMSDLESKSTLSFFLIVSNWVLVAAPIVVLVIRKKMQSEASAWVSRDVDDDLEDQQPEHEAVRVLVVRLIEVVLAFAPAVALLSVAYEMLFYVVLGCVLVSWLHLEATLSSSASSSWREVRRVFVFLVVVQIAFFGTGSVASMTSFQSASTRRFMTHSAPSTTQALVVLKLLIPFVLVACAFRLILLLPSERGHSSSGHRGGPRRDHQLPTSRYFLLIVAMTDVLAMQFLFLVKNEGSWKQMGNSIAVFTIANAQIVLFPLIFLLAGPFIRDLESISAVGEGYRVVEVVKTAKGR
ncbi:hypothetical protein BBJ28_00011600 [Nothophytophthora sp. Chile5]|nr:hypothetical protein BBJ28_00011600 [Nothophytophthora sp. Chile5]